MRHLLKLFIAILLFGVSLTFTVQAQETFSIKFQERKMGVVTRKAEKIQDRNGNYCAVIRVNAAHIKDYTFTGQYILTNETRYNEASNEATLFLSPDHKNNYITILCKSVNAPSERLDLGTLESLHVYDLTIRVNNDKSRTLVMPIVAVGGIMNYGVMLSFVKKAGPYFKFTYNFQSVEDAGDCKDDGSIVGSNNSAFFGSGTQQSRMSITAGLMYRFWQANVGDGGSTQGFYGYLGGGYGYANHYWETKDNQWLRNIDHSHDSFEAEVGLLYRHKAFAISAGAQTNSFGYVEGTAGIGLMF